MGIKGLYTFILKLKKFKYLKIYFSGKTKIEKCVSYLMRKYMYNGKEHGGT